MPISSWEEELRKVCREPSIQNIKETDQWPIGPPPKEQTQDYLYKMRNGTAPGVDGINVELMKNATEPFIDEIVDLLQDIWRKNEIPDVWLTTNQIPIPKIRTPKSVDDFRRITLCSVAYKIYTMFLLERLFEYVKIPLYQAGFQRNRSSDDQIFVTKRILEERWRKGLPTYVLSLDLKQAFDQVILKDACDNPRLRRCPSPLH